VLAGWPELRLEEPDLAEHFRAEANVGLLLGEPSGCLTDVDLDCAEALMLADALLPATASIFGRAGKPRSHREYIARTSGLGAFCAPIVKYVDPGADGTTLLELRSTGCQTMAPGSIHPCGEPVEWVTDGTPAELTPDELRRACGRLAAASLLVRCYPTRGTRHDYALAVAGALARALDEETAERVLLAIARAAGDEESMTRRGDLRSTLRRLAAERPASGWPRLAELIGERRARAVREWLDRDAAPALEPWEPLVPLDHARDLPPLPLDVLPAWLRDMVAATATAYQVPAEYPAVYALALVSAALAGKYVVEVRPGWRMPPTLYVLAALPPSERKTPVIRDLAEPVRDWERAHAESIAEARRDALARVKQLRAREEAALRRVARPTKGTTPEAAAAEHTEAARALDDGLAAVPPKARMVVEYATSEALAERMAAWGDRQVILSDEGAGVLAMTGRYARWGGADLDLLLRAYDGQPYTPARITRQVRPMHAATLAIALGAQPAAIVELLRHAPEIRERGLLARFLALVPLSRVGRRAVRAAPVAQGVAAEYARRLRSLLDVADEHDEHGRLRPRVVHLSRAADDVIAALERALEPDLGPGGRYERIAATACSRSCRWRPTAADTGGDRRARGRRRARGPRARGGARGHARRAARARGRAPHRGVAPPARVPGRDRSRDPARDARRRVPGDRRCTRRGARAAGPARLRPACRARHVGRAPAEPALGGASLVARTGQYGRYRPAIYRSRTRCGRRR
jgi:hypothetical protein